VDGLAESLAGRIGVVVGHSSGLHDHSSGTEVERQRHHFANVFDSRLLIASFIKPMSQWTIQSGQLQILTPQNVPQLGSPCLAQGVW
jgi:hypothetical protein